MKRLLVLSLFLFLTGCIVQPTEGQTCIVVDVIYAEQSVEESFELCGSTNLVADILNEHADTLQLELTSSSFGDYVSGLVGYNFETLGLNYFWEISVNDTTAEVGISELIVGTDDRLLFEASPY